MAKCTYCGAETQLFDSGIPVCVRCDGTRLSKREQIAQSLRQRLEKARERRETANQRFQAAMRRVPGGTPAPDGSYQIQQASREYHEALESLTKAVRDLNSFLSNGSVPPDLDTDNETPP